MLEIENSPAVVPEVIFIIDPDETQSLAVSSLLTGLGYRTVTFGNAEDFLDRLDGSPQGCIIAEMELPGISALQMLRTLQNRRIELPVIIITHDTNVSRVVEAFRLGVADYLNKTFIERTLANRVRAVLDEHFTQ